VALLHALACTSTSCYGLKGGEKSGGNGWVLALLFTRDSGSKALKSNNGVSTFLHFCLRPVRCSLCRISSSSSPNSPRSPLLSAPNAAHPTHLAPDLASAQVAAPSSPPLLGTGLAHPTRSQPCMCSSPRSAFVRSRRRRRGLNR
jgi:hypothetical protein